MGHVWNLPKNALTYAKWGSGPKAENIPRDEMGVCELNVSLIKTGCKRCKRVRLSGHLPERRESHHDP
jgi:hypothetical protein